MASETSWFASWFDSPYYHILYDHRDESEAEYFLGNLMRRLALPSGSHVLDLACGKGRHSRILHAMGYRVDGVDLSPASVAEARKTTAPGLHFRTGDMRQPQGSGNYDLVLNLFTSFGYFESEEENLLTLRSIAASLRPGGLLVIDYFNAERAIAGLIPLQETIKGGIRFRIEKSVENKVICKRISFRDEGRDWFFEERVQALCEPDFRRYFEKTGFEVVLLSGNYALEPFRVSESDRLIAVARKAEK